jgi:DNA helicase HerA-like ATPase
MTKGKSYNIKQSNKKIAESKLIGKTSSPEISPNTVDEFSFWITPGQIVNPFDFVSTEHVFNTRSVGVVKEMSAITDAQSHLSNFVSSEFGKLVEKPNTLRIDTTVARVSVMANTGCVISDREEPLEINMPVGNDQPVQFASIDEVCLALGTEKIEMKIPAGLIEMSNGVSVPVMLDARYLLGPEAAHVNISGISGLATKTSYMMFLIQSIIQKVGKDKVALIVFNVKQQDLLHIDEKPADLTQRDLRLYEKLGIEPKPFENVTYFLPRGVDGKPNSDFIPIKHKVYAYELGDVYQSLDLLFSEVSDPQFTIASIVDYIEESWPLRFHKDVIRGEKTVATSGQLVETWQDLRQFEDYPKAVVTHSKSLGKFQRHLRRLTSSMIFSSSRGRAVYLSEEIASIQPGQVFVVDINRIGSDEEQAFIIGDVMRKINEMYGQKTEGIPDKIIILIDELNRYAQRRPSAVSQKVIEIARTGRSRGTILFGAEQFKSAVNEQVHENSGTHVIGRTGASELSTEPYSFLDKQTKTNITRLGKGELVLVHAVFRQPIKIVFPKPSYLRQEINREEVFKRNPNLYDLPDSSTHSKIEKQLQQLKKAKDVGL